MARYLTVRKGVSTDARCISMIEQGPVAIVRLNDPRSTVFSRSTRENGGRTDSSTERSSRAEPFLFFRINLSRLFHSLSRPMLRYKMRRVSTVEFLDSRNYCRVLKRPRMEKLGDRFLLVSHFPFEHVTALGYYGYELDKLNIYYATMLVLFYKTTATFSPVKQAGIGATESSFYTRYVLDTFNERRITHK